MERLGSVARASVDEMLRAQRDVLHSVSRALEDTGQLLTSSASRVGSTAFAAEIADLVRSNSFGLAQGFLIAHERLGRVGLAAGLPAWASPLRLSRTLLLVSVAADLYTGYLTIRERSRWAPGLVNERDWQLQHARGATHVLDAAAALGGLLIKACQFASTRPDLLPSPYIETLARLQDRVPPRPWPAIESAIARELGRETAEVFQSIDPEPLASASLAQVHGAVLGDGRRVAVKVQYPEVADLVRADLDTLAPIVEAIGRVESEVQLQPIVDYLRETLPQELDFRREATWMTRLAGALAHRADVLIPTVVDELTTSRLLVMERVDGIKITDQPALIAAGIEPRTVARLLNDVYAEQMLRLGLLHGDPHPGNLVVLSGPRLVLFDHGLTTELPQPVVEALRRMVKAIAAGDADALNAAISEGPLASRGSADVAALLRLAGVMAGGGAAPPVDDEAAVPLSLAGIPLDLVVVGRALSLLHGITSQLAPGLDVQPIVAGYCSATDVHDDAGRVPDRSTD